MVSGNFPRHLDPAFAEPKNQHQREPANNYPGGRGNPDGRTASKKAQDEPRRD